MSSMKGRQFIGAMLAAGAKTLGDKTLIVTVVNPHASETRATEINLCGATIKSAQAATLAASDIHAHNGFDKPRAVEPKDVVITAKGASLVHQFPPASVMRLRVDLA